MVRTGTVGGEIAIVGSALILFVALWWASRNVAALRAVYATGSDSEAARLAGIAVTKVVFWVFVLTGALTGLAALAERGSVLRRSGEQRQQSGIESDRGSGGGRNADHGRPRQLAGHADRGRAAGEHRPALTFLGINPYWEKAIQGAIILVTVLLDAMSARRARALATR